MGAEPVEAPPPVPSQCPFCCEAVEPAARKCPHCQEYLDPELARAMRKGPSVSALAIASFVFGLLGPLTGPLAFMLGVLGVLATGKGKASGRGLALYGMLLGLMWTCLLILFLGGLAGWFPASAPSEPLF